MSSPLVIIPTFMREPRDLQVTLQTVASIRDTDPDVPVLLVDDCSPVGGLVDELATHRGTLSFDLERQPENAGFSRTINVGLRAALAEGRDAILVNADVEFLHRGWVATLASQKDTQRRPAAVVGALLLYANGLIQHAGTFFSMLTRSFDHRYRFGPALLPEANQACVCPVTGALQFIRHSTLQTVGLYDEDFRMGYEDVDYCLRTFDAGLECIYQPAVKAVHHESLFRGRADEKLNEWQSESMLTLMRKHGATNMSRFIPEIV